MNFREVYAVIFACIQICVYSNSYRFVNKLLVNSSFLVVQNIGLLQCARLCLDYNLCSAVSYLRTQLECRLNYFNDTTAPELLVHYDKGVYLRLEDILQEFGIMKLHSCPLNARYITTKQSLGVCIPMEFGHFKNIAVQKTTNQSSFWENKIWASGTKAVDNIWDSEFLSYGCFVSVFERNPWWSVDLRFAYLIVKIIILNRNYEGHNLQNVVVFMGLHENENDVYGTFPGPGISGQNITISGSVPKFARFIKIEQNAKGYLQLCEVGIYAPYAEK